MTITGKTFLFINEIRRADNSTFKTYSTSISSKDENGNYDHLSVEVSFGKEFTAETLKKLSPTKYYEIDIEEGILSFRTFTNKEGVVIKRPRIVILKGHVTAQKDAKPKKSVDDELPF